MKLGDHEAVMMETVLSELQLIVPKVETIIHLINRDINAKANCPYSNVDGTIREYQFVLEDCFSFLEEHLQKLAQINNGGTTEKPQFYIVE